MDRGFPACGEVRSVAIMILWKFHSRLTPPSSRVPLPCNFYPAGTNIIFQCGIQRISPPPSPAPRKGSSNVVSAPSGATSSPQPNQPTSNPVPSATTIFLGWIRLDALIHSPRPASLSWGRLETTTSRSPRRSVSAKERPLAKALSKTRHAPQTPHAAQSLVKHAGAGQATPGEERSRSRTSATSSGGWRRSARMRTRIRRGCTENLTKIGRG